MKVVVTGASRGIGRGIATFLAMDGFDVGLLARSGDLLEDVRQSIEENGGTCFTAACDLRKYDETQAAIAALVDGLGGIDALINNAGLVIRKSVLDISIEEWHAMMDTNVNGLFYATRAALPYLVERGAGHIINISSILGLVGQPNASDYNAAKGGVRLLTKSAALECAEAGYNIRVNTEHPGYIDTPLVRDALNRGVVQGQAVGPNEMRELLIMLHPVGRLGIAEEIANAILFLSSDESSFMTGSELVADGGYTSR